MESYKQIVEGIVKDWNFKIALNPLGNSLYKIEIKEDCKNLEYYKGVECSVSINNNGICICKSSNIGEGLINDIYEQCYRLTLSTMFTCGIDRELKRWTEGFYSINPDNGMLVINAKKDTV